MSYPYILDIAYGSELYTSDTYLTVSLGKKDPGPEPPGPEPDHYTVSWPYSEEYSITPDGYTPTLSDSTYSISVEDQTSLSFTVTPSDGYRLTSYTVDGNIIENPDGSAVTDSVQITKDISISAVTQSIIVSYTITLSADNNIKSMSKSVGEYSVNQGDSFEVVVEPKDGYTLSATCSDSTMTESAGSTPNSKVYTIPSVTKDCTLSIVGEVNGIVVNLPTVEHTTIHPITQSPVPSGSDFIFQVTPYEGYILGDVTVDGITLTGVPVVGTPNTMEYTIPNITSTPNVVIESPSVDEMKFYSGKHKAYNISTGEVISGYFKIDLDNIEDQNDREDLSQILPELKVVIDTFFYENDQTTATLVLDTNINDVCTSLASVLHSTSWYMKPIEENSYIYDNKVFICNGGQEYPIVFCSNGSNYEIKDLTFYGNANLNFEKSEELGRYDDYTGYVYDKRELGDQNDADMNYNVLELRFSNMGDSILNPDIIYSNGIRVFDSDKTMYYGQYRVNLTEDERSPEKIELAIKKLDGLKFVIDQYFYSGDYYTSFITPDTNYTEYSISAVSKNDVNVFIESDMSITIKYSDNGIDDSIKAYFYINGTDERNTELSKYRLYYVNDSWKSPEDLGWEGGCNSQANNGYVFDRTNEDLLTGNIDDTIRYGNHSGSYQDESHNSGKGQSAVTIAFLV